MKKFLNEFKEFIAQGNVMDMAVGIIIGSAFTAIVTSVVEDLLTPLITIASADVDFAGLQFHGLMYGKVINAIITFLLTAFILFLILKAINKFKKEKPAEDPTTKKCPYCKSEIDIEATKCPHCTSDVE